jgi:hypothetical protein
LHSTLHGLEYLFGRGIETPSVTWEAYDCANILTGARKEAARLSAYASCSNRAMLTGFDEDTSSIMVLVGGANEIQMAQQDSTNILSQMQDPIPSTRRTHKRK